MPPQWQAGQDAAFQATEGLPYHGFDQVRSPLGQRLLESAGELVGGASALGLRRHRGDGFVGFVYFVHFDCELPSPGTHLEVPP